MGRLFTRLYLILGGAMALYVVGIVNLGTLIHGPLEQLYAEYAQGSFTLLEQRLKALPADRWQPFIDRLNSGGGYPLRLTRFDRLKWPATQLQRLTQGRTVMREHDNVALLYHRILQSPWVLELPFNQTEEDDNRRLAASTFSLIEMELLKQPQAAWPQALETIKAPFTFPVVLIEMAQASLPESAQTHLQQGQVAWHRVDDDHDYLYRQMADSPYAVKLGPFYEPIGIDHLETLLLLALALLVAIAVLIWVYPLWRDLRRLQACTDALGGGDFTARVNLRNGSPLTPLSTAFDGMAERIQRLISSHKELTNAVSHELRTPIARLRFGMEMLANSDQPDERQHYMDGVNADIDELDQLVAEMLTYARFDRERPTLHMQQQPIAPWLEQVVAQAHTGEQTLSIECRIVGDRLRPTCFEPRLMARALGNLLQNARRYARHRVVVTFSCEDGHCQLAVDDDGTGIPEAARDDVFEPFTRLDTSRDRGTGGYGLGLAIVQRISRWHGGKARIEQSPIGGARFLICWPETAPDSGTPGGSETPA